MEGNTEPSMLEEEVYESLCTRRVAHLRKMAVLPASMKRRIQTLRKLQVETINFESQFHEKVYALEVQFGKLYNTVNKKRQKIIAGEYEPTDEECDFPDIILPPELEQLVNEMDEDDTPPLDEDFSNVKGIPKFWKTALKHCPMCENLIKDHDEPALEFLVDMRTVHNPDSTSFTIEFEFSPNPYFSNTVLTKEYFMKHNPNPDPNSVLTFEGPEIIKCKGCVINWKDGMDLTVRIVKRKGNLNPEYTNRTIKIASFFNFFEPPEPSQDMDNALLEDINAILEADFEIGHHMKNKFIPRAVLYYTGEIDDYSLNFTTEEEEEEEEEEEDDEDAIAEEILTEAVPAPESCADADQELKTTETENSKDLNAQN